MDESKRKKEIELARWKEFAYRFASQIYNGPIFKDSITEKEWNILSLYGPLYIKEFKRFEDKMNWRLVSYRSDLDIKFVKEFRDKLDWNAITNNIMDYPYDFVLEFRDRFNWDFITHNLLNDFGGPFPGVLRGLFPPPSPTPEFIWLFQDSFNWDILNNFGYTKDKLFSVFGILTKSKTVNKTFINRVQRMVSKIILGNQ